MFDTVFFHFLEVSGSEVVTISTGLGPVDIWSMLSSFPLALLEGRSLVGRIIRGLLVEPSPEIPAATSKGRLLRYSVSSSAGARDAEACDSADGLGGSMPRTILNNLLQTTQLHVQSDT